MITLKAKLLTAAPMKLEKSYLITDRIRKNLSKPAGRFETFIG